MGVPTINLNYNFFALSIKDKTLFSEKGVILIDGNYIFTERLSCPLLTGNGFYKINLEINIEEEDLCIKQGVDRYFPKIFLADFNPPSSQSSFTINENKPFDEQCSVEHRYTEKIVIELKKISSLIKPKLVIEKYEEIGTKKQIANNKHIKHLGHIKITNGNIEIYQSHSGFIQLRPLEIRNSRGYLSSSFTETCYHPSPAGISQIDLDNAPLKCVYYQNPDWKPGDDELLRWLVSCSHDTGPSYPQSRYFVSFYTEKIRLI